MIATENLRKFLRLRPGRPGETTKIFAEGERKREREKGNPKFAQLDTARNCKTHNTSHVAPLHLIHIGTDSNHAKAEAEAKHTQNTGKERETPRSNDHTINLRPQVQRQTEVQTPMLQTENRTCPATFRW